MNLSRNSAAVIAALLGLAGLAACQRNPETAMADKGRDQVATNTSPAPTAAANPSAGSGETGDSGITAQVKAAVSGELGDRARQIDVETIGGTVILSGTVDSQARSERAQQLAGAVSGVKSVDNRLTVRAGGVG